MAVITWSNNMYIQYTQADEIDYAELSMQIDIDSNYIFTDIKVAEVYNFSMLKRSTRTNMIIYEVTYLGNSIQDDLVSFAKYLEYQNDANITVLVQDTNDIEHITYMYDNGVVTHFR